MARLRAKYRDRAIADEPTLDMGAATDDPSAAAAPAPSHDNADPSLRGALEAMQNAERLELMRERISVPPPSETAVDDAIEAAKEQSPSLERDSAHDPEIEDDGESLDVTLAKTGLPPLAVHWLKSNPEFLYDPDQNARLQSLHHQLVAEGYEGYGHEYFMEIDRRLNGTDAVPFTSAEDDAIESAQHRPDPDTMAVDRALAAARNGAQARTFDIAPPRRAVSVSAPPSREVPSSGGYRTGGRVTLTPQQKEAARISGISETEYAANVLRLREEKANGNYGGSP